MWSPSKNTVPFMASFLVPTKVLYHYDGPQIFSSSVGSAQCLAIKTNETEGVSQFIVSCVSKKTLDAVEENSLSLREALETGWLWVLELDNEHYKVLRAWNVEMEDLEEDMLPVRGTKLRLEENMMLSIKFTGPALENEQPSLGVLKRLIDGVHSSVKQIIGPAIDALHEAGLNEHEINNNLIIPVEKLKFASLLIEIGDIKLNRPENSTIEGNVRDIARAASSSFLAGVEEINQILNYGDIFSNLTEENIRIIELMQDIVPTDQDKIDHMTISGLGADRQERKYHISSEKGKKIREAFKVHSRRSQTFQGRIMNLNQKKKSVVIITDSPNITNYRREITCYLDEVGMETAMPAFASSHIVLVSGIYIKRNRRDLLVDASLEIVPDIETDSDLF